MSNKCILLVRVSTTKQEYESQKSDLIQYAKYKGYDDYIILDDKESAIKLEEEERLGLNELKETITKDNSYNAVFVWEISRLARTQKVLFSMRDWLIENKINLYIKDKNYQLLKDDGSVDEDTSILFTLYAYFAESEMKLKKARFKRAKVRDGLLGKYAGGPLKFGYSVDENNYLIINESEASLIRLVYDLYLSGLSEPKVTLELRERGIIFKLDKVKQILHSPQYTGRSTKYGNERKYPVIIDENTYKKAREIAKNNNVAATKAKNIYYSRGLIKCYICQRNYIANLSSLTYICTSNRTEGYILEHGNNCGAGGININLLDSIVWDIAKEEEFFASIDDMNDNISRYENLITINLEKIKGQNSNIKKLNRKKEVNSDQYYEGDISKEKYTKRKNQINSELKEIENSIQQYIKENNEFKYLINSTQKSIDVIKDMNERNAAIEDITDDKLIYDIVHKHIAVITVNDIIKFTSKAIVIVLKNGETVKLKVNIRTKKLEIYMEHVGWIEREYKYIERFSKKMDLEAKKAYNKEYFKKNREKINMARRKSVKQLSTERIEKNKEYQRKHREKKQNN